MMGMSTTLEPFKVCLNHVKIMLSSPILMLLTSPVAILVQRKNRLLLDEPATSFAPLRAGRSPLTNQPPSFAPLRASRWRHGTEKTENACAEEG